MDDVNRLALTEEALRLQRETAKRKSKHLNRKIAFRKDSVMLTKQAAVVKMAAYLRYLAGQVPTSPKVAETVARTQAVQRLYKLAETLSKKRDIFAAVAEVYHDKSAAQQHQLITRLVKGLHEKLAKALGEEALQRSLGMTKEGGPIPVSTGDMSGALRGGLLGAGVGAAGMGLSGLVSPGQDEEGRRKSRIKEMLKGLLQGGLVGGGAGAVGGGIIGGGLASDLNSGLSAIANKGDGMIEGMKGKVEGILPAAKQGSAPIELRIKMGLYLVGLAEQMPVPEKVAHLSCHQEASQRLEDLAADFIVSGNLIHSINSVYRDKTAAFRHQLTTRLVSSFSKSALGCGIGMGATGYASGMMSRGPTGAAPTGSSTMHVGGGMAAATNKAAQEGRHDPFEGWEKQADEGLTPTDVVATGATAYGGSQLGQQLAKKHWKSFFPEAVDVHKILQGRVVHDNPVLGGDIGGIPRAMGRGMTAAELPRLGQLTGQQAARLEGNALAKALAGSKMHITGLQHTARGVGKWGGGALGMILPLLLSGLLSSGKAGTPSQGQ